MTAQVNPRTQRLSLGLLVSRVWPSQSLSDVHEAVQYALVPLPDAPGCNDGLMQSRLGQSAAPEFQAPWVGPASAVTSQDRPRVLFSQPLARITTIPASTLATASRGSADWNARAWTSNFSNMPLLDTPEAEVQ
jgi:hypothetical protein